MQSTKVNLTPKLYASIISEGVFATWENEIFNGSPPNFNISFISFIDAQSKPSFSLSCFSNKVFIKYGEGLHFTAY